LLVFAAEDFENKTLSAIMTDEFNREVLASLAMKEFIRECKRANLDPDVILVSYSLLINCYACFYSSSVFFVAAQLGGKPSESWVLHHQRRTRVVILYFACF